MRSELSAIRTTGAMLPTSLLSRIAAGDGDLGGMTSKDFHLPAGESPREAANRAWTYLTGVWARYRDALAALPDGDPAVGLTRERWLLVLFRELGYGQLPATPHGGIIAGQNDTAHPVSHLWGRTPIHLLGWNVELDRRTKGVAGAAARAPHAMVQELLNRSDAHLWAILSNGQLLRLLRDSSSLSGQAYVEFDLDAIFTGDLFSDFVVLFLLLHESRVSPDTADSGPGDCWLERWRSTAATTGARAMNLLREGVQSAIEELGTGFLRHPANADLRARLDDGRLTVSDYHLALLRLVYRLLFLFVAEDRGALLDPAGDPIAQARYRDYYSTARLRRVARVRRGTAHSDHWVTLSLVMDRLGEEMGCPELALPGIGGLFNTRGTQSLSGLSLANEPLLNAVRALSIVHPPGQPRQVVDYKNLGAEELGSIYESLLELVPRRNAAEGRFTLEAVAGNDRKTTGSYYTPTSLIDLVLDETLTPLLDEADTARTAAEREAALLRLTVCDPAVGSGHFLVAAGRRIAERLAVARTGEIDPTPADVTAALHDVVATCLYGVDVNPLAAELAKVSLWLESLQAGKPLTFLDAHIKVGNSLLGTTPALIAGGIPDGAFVVLDGDDKKATAALKKRNKRERDERANAQGTFFDTTGLEATSTQGLRAALTGATATRAGRSAASLAELHEVERRYAAYLASPDIERERLVADTWCAAFVQHKGEGQPEITTSTIDDAAAGALKPATMTAVHELAARYRFFHWHLEFPEIFEVGPATATEPNGWGGGFSAMLGNPPWERVKLQEQEFFAQREPAVAGAANAAARKKLIAQLQETDPALSDEWHEAQRQATATSHVLRMSGRYPLCGVGDVNTYAVFAELFRSSIAHSGGMGIITPTGLATDATTSAFFADTVLHKRLAAFYDFDNEAKIFPGVHHAYRFAVSCLTGGRPAERARLAFLVRHVRDAASSRFDLAADEILLLNPNTGTLPLFRTRKDAEITLGIYRRHPVLMNDRERSNPWGLRFGTLFHMANDSGLFRTADDLRAEGAVFDGWAWVRGSQRWVPLYEAKMLSHYDHRFSTYENATQAQLNVGTLPRLSEGQHNDPEKETLSEYWVESVDVTARFPAIDEWGRSRGYLVGWRKITRASDMRTAIPVVHPHSAAGNSLLHVMILTPRESPLLQAVWSSLPFDYVVRQKHSGANFTFFMIKQIAVPVRAALAQPLSGVAEVLGEWVRPRVLELTYTSYRIAPYAVDVLGLPDDADPGAPYCWIPERREILRAELDAAMFRLYGLRRDEVEHVLDSFPVVRKYEERDHGEFRTKRLVLEIYDAMAAAATHGMTYASTLNPPPGDGPRHPPRSAS